MVKSLFGFHIHIMRSLTTDGMMVLSLYQVILTKFNKSEKCE